MRVCLPSESTYGYLISLCHWAGWRLESQGFQGWDYAWRGWTIAPVWLKDLHKLRPCLLYICIAQFHKDAGNYQWPGSSYLVCYNLFSSVSHSCLPASRRGWGLTGNHFVWLTRICSDQYLSPGPTWWEKTNQTFTLTFRIKYQNTCP